MATLILGILFFLLLSAIFSGTEIAFLSANKLHIELRKKEDSEKSDFVDKFYEHPARFLATLLIGNNIALVIFTVFSTQLLEQVLPIDSELFELLLYTVLTTIVVLIFGEFLPKTLFRLYANHIIFGLSYLLNIIWWLLWFPAWLMLKLSDRIIGLFSNDAKKEVREVFTRLDLEKFIESGSADIEEHIDTTLFSKALQLHDTRVSDCMVPRLEVIYIDADESLAQLERKIKDSNLSRILVVEEGDIDNVVGYVHHQLLFAEDTVDIRSAVRDILIIPETMLAQDVMDEFIKNRMSIACVVDEFGGTAGVVTLEDILEELFGEIEDEHDKENLYVEEVCSDTEYLFSGRLELDYLNEKYENINLPAGEYHTLSGYLVMTTGKIPEQGEVIVLDDYKFRIENIADTRIETIRVVYQGLEND
ncbi:MAG: hemolysin family protein [Bacteroidota bacterium]